MPKLLDYSDYDAVRQDLRDRMLTGVAAAFPVKNDTHTLEVGNLRYKSPERYTLAEEKQAILENRDLSDKLVGTYTLKDAQGNVLGSTGTKTIMNVPYLTARGTYIRNGSELTLAKQLRLVPGVYAKTTDDGMVEAHVNAKPATGPSFRMFLEPQTGHFFLKYQNRKIPMYPVMRAMGYSHEQVAQTWGKDLAEKNKALERSPYAVNFLSQYKQREALRQDLLGAVEATPEKTQPAVDPMQDPEALDKDASDQGHVFITGPIGSGKTTMALQQASSRRRRVSLDELKALPGRKYPGDEEAQSYIDILDGQPPQVVEGVQLLGIPARKLASKGSLIIIRPSQKTLEDRLYSRGFRDENGKLFIGEAAMPSIRKIVAGDLAATDAYIKTTAGLPNVRVIQEESQKTAARSEDSAYTSELRDNIAAEFNRIELNPRSTTTTLGRAHERVTVDTMADASKKLLALSRGEAEADSRDTMEFQSVHDAADYFDEKLRKDNNGLLRNMMWKLSGRYAGDISKIPSGLLDKHVQHVFNASGVSQYPEEINPLDMYDQNQRITRLGEGGMTSLDSAPKDSRNVQPSYANFIDVVRAPESLRIGLDMKLAHGVRRGDDNQLYTEFVDPRTGKMAWVGHQDAATKTIAFPEMLKTKDQFVPAIVGGKSMVMVDRAKVDYVVPSGDHMFSDGANMSAMKSGIKGMRLLMGSKFSTAALPLVSRESPLVQTRNPSGQDSVEKSMGRYMGARLAPVAGTVRAVYKDHVDIVDDTGEKQSVELYDNHSFARKTFLRNTPVVKAGDRVKAGQVLATSNFTDDNGESALGTNLRTAYLNYDGKVYEDANVISESAAKKLTSEHLYPLSYEKGDSTVLGRREYLALYPNKFNRQQLQNLDETGVVKPGTVVNFGDPLLLAHKDEDPSPMSMGRRIRSDDAMIWDHHFPGVVTDAVTGRGGTFSINVRANAPMQVGDKLANRQGGKGVVADILPDNEMPCDARGRPFELLTSPLGVTSRTNPSQLAEVALGKVAQKTGKKYVLPGFMDEDIHEYAIRELDRAGLKDSDDLTDPRSGKVIPGVFNGVGYYYKLQQTSEGKGKSRSVASYTAEDQPSKGGAEGAKHIGPMELDSLRSHGADAVMKDMKLIKGQKNDEFWRSIKLGQTPVMPGTPLVYEKFKGLIRAAGVDLREDRNADQIFGMTDKRAQELTGTRKISRTDTYTDKSAEPIPGGLFDPEATGSMGDGDRWAYIELPEKLPNPVMADPLRSILGLKRKEFDAVVAEGGGKLEGMLKRVDLQSEGARALDQIKTGNKSERDDAIKRFRYISAMLKDGTRPEDFMMSRVPVLPPKFRPITKSGGMTMVADPNYMYKSLLESAEDFQDAKTLPEDVQREARAQVYKTYQQLVGTADPDQPQMVQKGVKGILSQIFGKGSPKYGFVQRRVIGTNLDATGLGVVTPNPALRLNEVGMPENLAWSLYEPFIIRELVKKGVPATQAAKAVADRTAQGYSALQQVVQTRPVIINRAPTLHKLSMSAAWPVLTKGNTLQTPPAIVKPLGLDYDGDTMSFSVPVSAEAVEQAKQKMLPEKNLLSLRNGAAAYAPGAEFLPGFYYATKPPTSKPVQYFRTQAEAMAAYRSGKIRIDDPIKIVPR